MSDINDSLKYKKLNPVTKKKFKRRIHLGTSHSSNMREAVRELLFSNQLDLEGEYLGIVISNAQDKKSVDSFSITDSIMSFFGDQEKSVEFFKVRVPELHSMIPAPVDENDGLRINLHTSFEVNQTEVNVSKNDLVYVSFYNASGVYAPRILRKATNIGITPKEQSSSRQAFLKNRETSRAEVFTGPPAPPVLFKEGDTVVRLKPSEVYQENRVRIHGGNGGFDSLEPDSSLLETVVSAPDRNEKLHTLVAQRFNQMRDDASKFGIDLRVYSGWRKRRWPNRAAYEDDMIKEYGSVSKGERLKAYQSPHETGMAVDFYIEPVESGDITISPSIPGRAKYGSETNTRQKRSFAHLWLEQNAHLYGFTPYKREAWHWECLLPLENWISGNEFTDNYALRVEEESVANGTLTRDRNFRIK